MPIDRLANTDVRQRRALQRLEDLVAETAGRYKLLAINFDSGAPVSNTTQQTGLGLSTDLPAGYFAQQGSAIACTASGKHSTTGTPTLRIRLKAGDKVLFDSGAITCGSGVTDEQWLYKVLVVAKTVGAQGTLNIHLLQGYLNGIQIAAKTTVAAFNTTNAHKLRWTVEWSAASTSNITRQELFMVEALAA